MAGGAVNGGRLVPAHYSQPGCAGRYDTSIVLAHARALLASSPPGSTSYVDADVRDTSGVLEQAAAALDFSAPGVVRVPEWRPSSAEAAASPSTQWGGVGRKA